MKLNLDTLRGVKAAETRAEPKPGPQARAGFKTLHTNNFGSKLSPALAKQMGAVLRDALQFNTPEQAGEVIRLAHTVNRDPHLRAGLSKKDIKFMEQVADSASRAAMAFVRSTAHDFRHVPLEHQTASMHADVLKAQHVARTVADYAPVGPTRASAHYASLNLFPKDGIAHIGSNASKRAANTPYQPMPSIGKQTVAQGVFVRKDRGNGNYVKEVTAGGHSYAMGPVAFNGQFGQARFALKDAEEVIIKVQRTNNKITPNTERSTLRRDTRDILKEGHKTNTIANRIANFLRARGYDRDDASNPFAGVRSRISNVGVQNTFLDAKGKVYQVTEAHDGNALALRKHIASSDAGVQSAVTRSVAAQAFTELEAMHGASKIDRMFGRNKAHRDLKLDNMVFNKHGSLKLIDFDTATRIGLRGLPTAKKAGRVGTTISPEMLDGKSNRFGEANDVWAMSASILEFFQPEGAKPSPFLGGDMGSGASGKQRHVFEAFDTYRELALKSPSLEVSDADFSAALGRQGRTVSASLLEAKGELQEFFQAGVHKDVTLTTTLLREGMNPDPKKRTSAAQLAEGMRKTLPKHGSDEAEGVRDAFAGAAESQGSRIGAFLRLRKATEEPPSPTPPTSTP